MVTGVKERHDQYPKGHRSRLDHGSCNAESELGHQFTQTLRLLNKKIPKYKLLSVSSQKLRSRLVNLFCIVLLRISESVLYFHISNR